MNRVRDQADGIRGMYMHSGSRVARTDNGQVQHKAIHNIIQFSADSQTASKAPQILTHDQRGCADGTVENATLPAHMRDYKFTGTMRPVYPLSPRRTIPDHIVKPDWADHRTYPILIVG